MKIRLQLYSCRVNREGINFVNINIYFLEACCYFICYCGYSKGIGIDKTYHTKRKEKLFCNSHFNTGSVILIRRIAFVTSRA